MTRRRGIMRLQLAPTLVGIAIFIALAGVACSAGAGEGGSNPSNGTPKWPTSPAGIAAYQGADRQQMLEQGARQEAGLTWYTPLIAGIQTTLVKQFETKYPYVKMEVFRADSTTILTKSSEEFKAKKPGFDVMDLSWGQMQALKSEGVLMPYYTAQSKITPKEAEAPAQGNLVYGIVGDRDCFSFAYNTNLLPASAVPKTYQDLLNPALKSKLDVAGTSTGANWIGNILVNQSQTLAEQLAKQQDMKVQQISAKALLDLIASGEVAGSPTVYKPHVMQAIANGAPVKWVPLEPVTCTDGLQLASAIAPHPHAAMLWMDFVLGPDGQKIMKDLGYDVGRDLGFKAWIPDQGKTLEEAEKSYNQWQQFIQSQFIQKQAGQ